MLRAEGTQFREDVVLSITSSIKHFATWFWRMFAPQGSGSVGAIGNVGFSELRVRDLRGLWGCWMFGAEGSGFVWAIGDFGCLELRARGLERIVALEFLGTSLSIKIKQLLNLSFKHVGC